MRFACGGISRFIDQTGAGLAMLKMATDRVENPRSCWPNQCEVLHLAQKTDACTVLGLGRRAVLWVQGCPFRCPGCVAPETQPFRGGETVDVGTLADELNRVPDIEGLTFSGGEPFAQAAALANLIDQIRNRRPDLSFMSYTGFTLEYLVEHGTNAQKTLLRQLDILIDGSYQADRHTNLRWRGSDNQRVHFLTDRYRHLEHDLLNDRGTWLEFVYHSSEQGEPVGWWMGIPPQAFREAFEKKMQDSGIRWAVSS